MQVFYWIGPGTQKDGKVFYQAFALNGVNYKIGAGLRIVEAYSNTCASIDKQSGSQTWGFTGVHAGLMLQHAWETSMAAVMLRRGIC
jgi:hypothetical protein